MPRVRVTRRLHFSAAHRLHREEWSEEKNARVFGACSNPNWHGHNYELDVSVEGEIDPETGFVMDLKALKERVRETAIEDLDHRNLNLEVPWIGDRVPTTENLVVALWERIEPRIPDGVELVKLTLWETPRNYVEFAGR